ncbi:MAG: DUF1028 domain-containing protein [Bryobacteraceae bacterium]
MKRLACLLMITAAIRAENVSTFSIVGHDPVKGDWGVAVASRYFSVGAVVPWAEAGVGAIATQANVNVGYGPRGIELLKQGLSAKAVIGRLQAEDKFPGADGRQIAVIDGRGGVAALTGSDAPRWAGDRQGKTWSAQGNILVGPGVVEAMGKAFEATGGELAEKLFAALKAGDDFGGDARGKQSASMLVVRKGGGRNTNNDRYVYINVDDNPEPIPELRRLLDLNLGLNYQGRIFRLLAANQLKEAREDAARAVRYMPRSAYPHLVTGLIDYSAGNKPAATAALRKARELDPNVRKQFEGLAKNREAFRSILDDQEFLRQVFPAQ